MKWMAWLITLINIYFGVYFLLNVFNILKSSKYSPSSNVVFAIIFLAMSAIAIYLVWYKVDYKAALMAAGGPWLISLLFLLFNMLVSDYK
jgi:hypothetical protein